MKIRPSIKYSFLLSFLFLIIDQKLVIKYIGAQGRILSDMLHMSMFLYFSYLIIKIVKTDKNQKYTFWKGYRKGFLLGVSAIGIYLFMSVIVKAFYSIDLMNFLNETIGSLPNMVAEGVIKMILIFIFSFIIPFYYLIFTKTKDREELDEMMFRE